MSFSVDFKRQHAQFYFVVVFCVAVIIHGRARWSERVVLRPFLVVFSRG